MFNHKSINFHPILILYTTQVSRQNDFGFTTSFKGYEHVFNNHSVGVKDGRARIPIPPRYKEVGISGLEFKVYNFYLSIQLTGLNVTISHLETVV